VDAPEMQQGAEARATVCIVDAAVDDDRKRDGLK
jgi:hypothetical protein